MRDFPLEDREVDDFAILKELDAELHSRGLDHFVDILDLPELATHLMRGGRRDPLDLLGVSNEIARLVDIYGGSALDALAEKAKQVVDARKQGAAE